MVNIPADLAGAHHEHGTRWADAQPGGMATDGGEDIDILPEYADKAVDRGIHVGRGTIDRCRGIGQVMRCEGGFGGVLGPLGGIMGGGWLGGRVRNGMLSPFSTS